MTENVPASQSLLSTLGVESAVDLTSKYLRAHPRYSVARQRILEEALADFLVTCPPIVERLLQGNQLTSKAPQVARELLLRAYARASDPERNYLAGVADRNGLKDVLPADTGLAVPSHTASELTRSQSRAARQLDAYARLHFSGRQSGGIRLRTTPLLIGPSGVGTMPGP